MTIHLPLPVVNRTPLNPRLAIKSSLREPKSLIAIVFLLYFFGKESSICDYSEIHSQNQIQLKDEIINELKDLFSGIAGYSEADIVNYQKENPLCTMQTEPLQVALQSFLKLGTINILNDRSSSGERTGGVRFQKIVHFSTNLILLENILTNINGELFSETVELLYNWLLNKGDILTKSISYKKLEHRLKLTLFSFTENTLYQLWNGDNEIIFQTEGVYKHINSEDDSVNLASSKEIKGTLRNLKSALQSDLHPFLKSNGDMLLLKSPDELEKFKQYKAMVSTMLDLAPRSKNSIQIEQEETPLVKLENITYQTIYFGSPGTGKSHQIDEITKNKNVIRTTFHPDTDYYSFVGSYRPIMSGNDIHYEFVPQAFTKAYCNAWLNSNEIQYLVIEEINRGNCSQIFGDIFQILDRDKTGFSKYEIEISAEMATYIGKCLTLGLTKEQITDYNQITKSKDGEFNNIKLPDNLIILATMNTSDQSLFPMDSAFKRRWDWQYVAIDYEDAKQFTIDLPSNKSFNWSDFLTQVNPKILELTGSQDKQIGNRFINPKDKTISFEQFRSKVLFYLWHEIYKDEYTSPHSIFKYQEDDEYVNFQFSDLFSENATEIIEKFLQEMQVNINVFQEDVVNENSV